MDQYRNVIYKEAIEVFGLDKQQDKWHEEVGELMQAINKYKLNPTSENLEHIYEETIDVEILTGQLLSVIPEERRLHWFGLKIEKLNLRVKKEKERRAQYAEDLKNNNPRYYEIFKLINDMNRLPLDGEIQELIRVVLETEKS
jgi:NTP pyrophosphatase (non-canonical NTP hydrolase)